VSTDFTKGLHELGDGLWAYLQPSGSWCLSNAGLIAGDGTSLLVDTLMDLRLTREMLDAMAPITRTRPIDTLVNTHANGDHCYGNELVPDRAEIYANFGRPPTRGTFSQAAKDGSGANREIVRQIHTDRAPHDRIGAGSPLAPLCLTDSHAAVCLNARNPEPHMTKYSKIADFLGTSSDERGNCHGDDRASSARYDC